MTGVQTCALPICITAEAARNVQLLVPPDGHITWGKNRPLPPNAARNKAAEAMRETLATEANRELYKKRQGIVEPVFGQIKEVRGYRRTLLRGIAKVRAEWNLICLTHNLLKLFGHREVLQTA